MSAKEPTWFVRLQGHILGPLSTEELKASLREGEINLGDKINRSGEDSWRVVSDHQDFAAYWRAHRAKAPSFEMPSPAILWKKARGNETVAPASLPAADPVPPVALPVAPIAEALGVSEKMPEQISPAKEANLVKTKKAKQPKKSAKSIQAEPAVSEAANEPAPAPVQEVSAPEVEPPAPAQPKPEPAAIKEKPPRAAEPMVGYSYPPEKSEIEKEIIRMLEVEKAETRRKALEAVAAFPERPEVPIVEKNFLGPERKTSPRQRAFYRNFPWEEYLLNKQLRIAAGAALLLLVAAVAYYAGQKTRDLKELPLSDPSSPTTQLPAASDPIQPLRAPTRPERD